MSRIWAITTLVSLLAANPAVAAGLLPVPTLTGAQIRASAREDPVNGWFVFSYRVTNPAGNTGEIWNVKIDVLDPANEIQFSTGGLTLPLGAGRLGFSDFLSRIALAGEISPTPVRPNNIVPFGQNAPPGWSGGLGLDGFASFHSSDETPNIVPGSSLAGFELLSFGLPSIREAQLIPFWMYVVEDHGVSPSEEALQAGEIERKLPLSIQTLGPSGVTPGSAGHWNSFRDDLAKAIQLGWIVDPKLANALTAQLASARAAYDASDPALVNARVQLLIDTISLSTSEQRNAEAHALVLLNAQRLIFSIPTGFEPAITLDPKGAERSVGDRHVISVSVVNRADNNSPLPDIPVVFRIEGGPNVGVFTEARTDANGRATLGYVGQAIGIDKLVAEALIFGGEVSIQDTGEVLWSGGADLTVPLFSPPLLITAGGRPFFLHEETENIGNLPSPPSVTRYFISPNQNIDPATAQVVGERNVPALQSGEASRVSQQVLAIPSGLPPGMYFLAACADANQSVTELNEQNNCSFSELRGRQSFIVPVETSNRSPDCSRAAPSVTTLRPPNHRLVPIAIQGVSDPDGDTVTLTVDKITQDEPICGRKGKHGKRQPDGVGVGTSTPSVRAERSGKGDGRVYGITFTASDGRGGSCTAAVRVGVPRHRGGTAIDSGQKFDSTVITKKKHHDDHACDDDDDDKDKDKDTDKDK